MNRSADQRLEAQSFPEGASPSHRTKWNGVPQDPQDVTSPDPREGVKCLPPRDGLFWAPAPSCEIHSLYKLFFKKKVASSSMDFFYKIHLPFWLSQSQEEHRVTRVAETPLIALGASPLLALEPSAPPSSQSTVASQELYPGSSVELGPGCLFSRSVLGFENHFLLEPGTPPCQLLASGTSSHNAHPRWVPAVGSDNPVERRQRALLGRLPVYHWTELTGDQGDGPRGRGRFHFLLSW